MRVRAYVLTFIGYLMLHVLRTGYSISKPSFKKEYDLDNLFVAVIDATTYIALGIGYFLRPLMVGSKNTLLIFFLTTMISALGYMVFPFLSVSHNLTVINAKPLMLIGMLVYGFFQFNFWSNMMAVISDHYSNENDGCLIGLWSAAGDFGNIVGFLIPSLLETKTGLGW